MIKAKSLFFFLLLGAVSGIFAINPVFTLKASGDVTDMVKENNHLYVATDAGTVDVFNILQRKIIKRINLPGVTDFMGDSIQAKVYSVDKIPESEDILIVCQGTAGFRNVFVYNGKLSKIIDAGSGKMMIKEARFVNSNLIIMGLTSDELVLYNIIKRNIVYRKQISHYTFADLVLSENRKQVLTSDESGVVQMFETASGNPVKTFQGNNVDNVFRIDFKNSVLICGGQDRRLAVYNSNRGTGYYIQRDFLIYCVGLCPDGKKGAYSANEDNDVVVFDIASRKELFVLKGQVSTLTGILFYSDNELITSCESEEILFWKLN